MNQPIALDTMMPDIEQSELYQLWRERRGERRYPARRDFDVRDFTPWLGDIELVDIVRADRIRYRFRLVGTNITAIDGIDVTGRFADEVFADNLDYIVDEYETVMRTGEPCVRPRKVSINLRGFEMLYHKLVLPLAADGETIDMLLVHLIEVGRIDKHR